ncbi:hypothetical protein DB30_00201 [Enhygromyxa salina]|uniref:Uncharacterized protein n=1 Tax=Enhygromyxa salina TaxID=215803 RepID=A0A0C2D5Q9_9BACT|nr:hypothetical protein [Enhygromyxa salina]KIG18516.1 hypothetical protein DB30_00201 [Enhygromyxa salina]
MMSESTHPTPIDWWPVSIDDRIGDALDGFIDTLQASPVELDLAALEHADACLTHAMQVEIHDIIDGAALSHYCHLINGWGDARLGGGQLGDGLGFYARSGATRPYIRQFHRDGDFHPWQTLAYAVMAGADLDRELPGLGVTLRQLYLESREIPTAEGEELGHLLFALAHMDPPADFCVELDGRTCGLVDIMELAITAHHHGHFRVCCKTHLSEGICAAAAKLPSLHGYREQAQAFLDGQLDMMLLLTLAGRERCAAQLSGQPLDPGSLSEAILKALARTSNFEDHLFFAGHLLELGVFAASFGYELPQVHRRAMALLANLTNTILPQYLGRSGFAEHFLFYGHYRRAITLLPTMLAAADEPGWTLDRTTLAAFTVDFNLPREAPQLVEPPGADAWTIAPAAVPRANFLDIVQAARAQLPEGFELRGNRAHYRHIKPHHWPKSLHYELLDHTSQGPWYALELHVEDDVVAALIPALAAQQSVFAAVFGEPHVAWVPSWGNGARLQAFIPDDSDPEQVARLVRAAIDRSYAEVDRAYQALRERVGPLGLTQPELFTLR